MEYRRDYQYPIPLRRSILTRFTLTMSLFVVLSTVGTGLLVLYFSNMHLRDGIRQRNEQVAQRAAGEISSFFQMTRRDLHLMALLLPMGDRDGHSASVLLENMSLEMTEFRRVALVDREGAFLADNALGRLSLSDFDPKAVGALWQGMGQTGWATRLDPQGLPMTTLIETVDWNGAADAGLLAEVDLRRVWDIVDGILIGESGFAYLASAEGTLIAHPDKGLVLRSDGSQPPVVSGFRVVSTVPDLDWTVTIVQQEREAFLPLRTVFIQSLLLIAFFTVLSSLVGVVFVRRTSRPVKSLLAATDALGAGDMDYRIDLVSQDEFGIIARSFNEMAGSLKARTEDLEESEGRLRMITESVTDVIFSLDSRGCFTFLTSRIEGITGFVPGELMGRFLGEILAPGDANHLVTAFLRAPSSGHQESITAQPLLLAKDGRKVDFETEIVKLVEPDGTMLFHGVGRDVTERRKFEERMRRIERLSLLGELSAGVAHELRNSMSGILGFSRTLRITPHLDDRAVHDLERIQREADHAQRLLQDLLSFGRVGAPILASCSWNAILEESLEACSYELESAGLSVRKDLAAGLPAVRADAAQMRDVFVNLIRNAAQAIRGTGKAGTIRIETDCRDSCLRAVITDSGPGIPPAEVDKVFDPFHTTKTGGAGIGLSVSLRAVQAHGGDIRAENREGWGASFSVELPLSGAAGSGPVPYPSSGAALGASASAPPTALQDAAIPPGCRIILAEDEDSIRDYIGRFLRSKGCEVHAAVNGRETMEVLGQDRRFDLILSDLRMPDMDGEELYSWILAHKPALLKRMIFLTGDLATPRSREFLSSTGVAYLEKPIVMTKLVRVIADAMRQSGHVGG